MSVSFATPWTVARQAPLSMGFPRQDYWSGLPFSSLGDLPDPRDQTHAFCIGRQITTEPPLTLVHWSSYQYFLNDYVPSIKLKFLYMLSIWNPLNHPHSFSKYLLGLFYGRQKLLPSPSNRWENENSDKLIFQVYLINYRSRTQAHIVWICT